MQDPTNAGRWSKPVGDAERPTPDLDGERRTTLKRRAYVAVVLLTTLLLVWLSLVEGVGTSYWGIVYPVLATYDVVLLAVLWRRRLPLRVVEALVLGPLVVVVMGFLAVWRVAPGGRSIVSLAVLFAVMIALLWVLASRLEELASARTEARLFGEQAVTDPLTGLANRRQLDDELDRRIAGARHHGQPLSVVLIDIDRFKAINDRLGHEVGDHVLIGIARRLTGSVRTTDVLGRWGGEEFLLISPHTDHEAALELAERCRAGVAETSFRETVRVTASFGVATLASGEEARSLVRRADQALYRAKDEGRDRVVGATERTVVVPGPA